MKKLAEKISLVEALNKAFTFRKYYLIRRIKPFCQVKPYEKAVLLPADKADDIPQEQAEYIKELCSDHGYSFQLVIPNGGGVIYRSIIPSCRQN